MMRERCSSSSAPSGHVREARRARARARRASAGVIVAQQRLRVLAARHERTGELQALRRLQHQQHALGAGELGRLVDQEFVQLLAAAQLVQAQAGVDQPLERLAQARLAREVRGAPLADEPAPARVREPRARRSRGASSILLR